MSGSGARDQGSGISDPKFGATDPRPLAPNPCVWCAHRPAERGWNGRAYCIGCWLDLTVVEYLRAWSTDPAVARAYTYKGVPLAATLEYELLEELISMFGNIVGGGPRSVVTGPDATKRVPPDDGTSVRP